MKGANRKIRDLEDVFLTIDYTIPKKVDTGFDETIENATEELER